MDVWGGCWAGREGGRNKGGREREGGGGGGGAREGEGREAQVLRKEENGRVFLHPPL